MMVMRNGILESLSDWLYGEIEGRDNLLCIEFIGIIRMMGFC